MNIGKDFVGTTVDKTIDQAAKVAKQKVSEMTGGKQQKTGTAEVTDMLNNAAGKVHGTTVDQAADTANKFSKKFLS